MNCVKCFKGVYLCTAVYGKNVCWACGIFFFLVAVTQVATRKNWHAAILPVCYLVLNIHPCERQTRQTSARLTAFGRCVPFLRFSVKDSEQRKRVIEEWRGAPVEEESLFITSTTINGFFPFFHCRRSSTGSRGDPTFHSAIILLARRESSTLPPSRVSTQPINDLRHLHPDGSISKQFRAFLSYSNK